MTEKIEHTRLKCGIDLAVLPLTGRPIVAVEMRLLAGYAFEAPEYLGVAHVLDEAIVKGTAARDGRALNDAFDAIGATHSSYAGREAFGFSCLCLPEFLRPAMALHAEMIRTPRFAPEDCEMAVELTQQMLSALADDPQELAKKMLHQQAYGQPLGRHVLGEEQTLERIGREQILDHWRRCFSAQRMQVAVAGAIDGPAVAELFEELFEGFAGTGAVDVGGFGFQFRPGRMHHEKELEQEQIAICFPGPGARDADFPTAQVILGVLSGGMGARLFTEVREKQGLVYWVGAWNDQSRTSGMFHLGASTTPQNLEKTYTTLLREIDRLSEDLTEAERERAISGIVTRAKTHGDITRSRALELSDDLFFLGRPLPTEEKMAKIQAVTIEDIRVYLQAHPRNALSVVTLGPKPED